MLPKIIHFCSKDYCWEERLVVGKNSKRAPGWDVKLWNDETNESFIREHYPQFIARFLNLPENVIRIDVARCLYLHYYGGIYIDTDYIVKTAPEKVFFDGEVFLGIEEERSDAIGGLPKYGNAFLASSPGLQFWLDFVSSVFDRYEAGEDRIVFIGGPHALSKFIGEIPEYRDTITELNQSVIYPDFKWHKITTKTNIYSFGAHLCWGSWRNKPLGLKIKNYFRRTLSAVVN